jgi:hypothetical protein
MTILNAGRTGVERGAYQGAVTAGLTVTGVCRRGLKDELGPLPPELASVLTPCEDRGMRAAVLKCLEMASAVLIVVPHRREVTNYPHLVWLLKRARATNLPVRIHDDDTPIMDTIAWALAEDRALYVTGPRGTRWAQGESVARRLLRAVRPLEAIA